jgi:hypothetical protein
LESFGVHFFKSLELSNILTLFTLNSIFVGSARSAAVAFYEGQDFLGLTRLDVRIVWFRSLPQTILIYSAFVLHPKSSN